MMFFLKYLTFYLKHFKKPVLIFTSLNIFNKKQTKTMKKLIFVLVAALTLTSVQSNAQTWGSVISGSTGSDLVDFLQLRTSNGTTFTQVPGAPLVGTTYANSFQLLSGSSPFTTNYTDAVSGNVITNYFFAFSWWNTRYYYTVSTSLSDGATVASNFGRLYYSSASDMNTGNNSISGISQSMTAPDQNVPIDGGVSLLLGAGAVAHLRRKKIMAKLKNA